MLTQDTHREATRVPVAPSEPLHDENVELIRRRVSQLRDALEAASRDNADLRRRLSRALRENEELRRQTIPQARHPHERLEQWRDALSAPWSRNP